MGSSSWEWTLVGHLRLPAVCRQEHPRGSTVRMRLNSGQHGACDADGYLGRWPCNLVLIEKGSLILTFWGLQSLPVSSRKWGWGGITESLIRKWQWHHAAMAVTCWAGCSGCISLGRHPSQAVVSPGDGGSGRVSYSHMWQMYGLEQKSGWIRWKPLCLEKWIPISCWASPGWIRVLLREPSVSLL